MSNNERLGQVGAFVKERLEKMAMRYPSEEHDAVYRWEHTLRVTQYGVQIAQAEGADVETVAVACLLHDIAHFDPQIDYKDHGRLGAQISRPFLLERGYPATQVENICYAIAVHVDGKADFEHPDTLEASVVSDADNVDRFGAYRILQWCLPEMGNLAALTEKLRKRMVKLEEYLLNNPLETGAGKTLFAMQLERQIKFFKAMIEEYERTRMPVIGG